MPTVQVDLTAGNDEAERIARLLEAAFEDEGYPVTREETPPYSLIWTVSTLFWDAEPDEAIARVKDALGTDAFGTEPTAQVLDDNTNWIAQSLEVLRPVAAGRFMVHGSHDRAAVTGSTIGLEIDAQMAFGTGHHATTWGCLAALDRLLHQRRFGRVLDLGTGTGVLAFAVAKVQKSVIVGTDIDRVATDIAAVNAGINGVAPLMRLITADGLSDRRIADRGPYDLVIANILARPLMKLARAIRTVTAPGGTLVLSGLRDVDGPKVEWAYRLQGFVLRERREKDHWLTLVLDKPGSTAARGRRADRGVVTAGPNLG